jgi:hypothetical protein
LCVSHEDCDYQYVDHGDLRDAFVVDAAADGYSWTVTGACPACSAKVARVYRVTAITAGAGGGIAIDGDKGALAKPRTMVCDCAAQHFGRPEKVRGCGAAWKIRLA